MTYAKGLMDNTHPSGLLQPLPISLQPCSHIAMDFIEGLLNLNGFNSLWVVVDGLTKYSHFSLLKHPHKAKIVVELFL